MSTELKVLRGFAGEFSPLHQTMVNDMSYSELFDIAKEIVEAHYGKL